MHCSRTISARFLLKGAILLLAFATSPVLAQSAAAELLREQLEYGSLGGELIVSGERLHAAPAMLELYAGNNFELLWMRPQQMTALEMIAERITQEGLYKEDLPLSLLRQADTEAQRTAAVTDLVHRDLLASETFIRAAYLLYFGKVNPQKLDNDWNFNRAFDPGANPIEFLRSIIDDDRPDQRLIEAMPRGPLYFATMEALKQFRQIEQAGGWQAISTGPTLRENDRDGRVAALRERLRITGQLSAAADNNSDLFDAPLVAAVQLFQDQHGLGTDGLVGGGTLRALNVPVEQRVDELRMALERMRWVLDDLSDNMLMVNIAGFRAALIQKGLQTWDGRVMVGKPYRKTPIFRGDMEYLVFNPTWTVPPGILAKDTLPAIQRDANYLERTNMAVLTRDGTTVNPDTVDWQSLTARGFPYILRQKPGPKNAMGQVKFIFPMSTLCFCMIRLAGVCLTNRNGHSAPDASA